MLYIIIIIINYGSTSVLKYSSRQILSQEGVQQGDPLGPLIFCLSIHPTLQLLKTEFVVGYMDDITIIGGSAATVANDINIIVSEGSSKGLHLNIGKCELISDFVTSNTAPLDQFVYVKPDDATLLGAPLLTTNAMDTTLNKKLVEFKRASERLCLISSHDALVLLKSSCSSPKLLHVLRTSSCDGHATLTLINDVFRECLIKITNVDISDLQWTQATLPVKAGGLGLRSPLQLALPAFLASVKDASTAK